MDAIGLGSFRPWGIPNEASRLGGVAPLCAASDAGTSDGSIRAVHGRQSRHDAFAPPARRPQLKQRRDVVPQAAEQVLQDFWEADPPERSYGSRDGRQLPAQQAPQRSVQDWWDLAAGAPEKSFGSRDQRPHRAQQQVHSEARELLLEVCRVLRHPSSEAEQWADKLERQWLTTRQQLRGLSAADWSRLGVPIGLRTELQQRLGVRSEAGRRQPRAPQRPSSAPAVRRPQERRGGVYPESSLSTAQRAQARSSSQVRTSTNFVQFREQLQDIWGDDWIAAMSRALHKRQHVGESDLQNAFQRVGLPGVSIAQLRAILRAAAPHGGAPDAEDVLSVLHGPVKEAHARALAAVYDAIDTAGRGCLDPTVLKKRCVATEHPAVKAGGMSAADALQAIMRPFRIGPVSPTDFIAGHRRLSTDWPGDDSSFGRMVGALWRVPLTGGSMARAAGLQEKEQQPHLDDPFELVPPAGEMPPRPPGRRGRGLNRAADNVASLMDDRSNDMAPVAFTGRRAMEEAARRSSRGTALLNQLRQWLARRGVQESMQQLVRRFGALPGFDGFAHVSELAQGLIKLGCGLPEPALLELLQSMDVERRGVLELDTWFRCIRPPLNALRAQLVIDVFNQLDRDGDGLLSVREVRSRLLSAQHTVPADEGAIQNLLRLLGDERREQQLTAQDMLNYYESVSLDTDDDFDFQQMLQRVWRLKLGRNADKRQGGHSSGPGMAALRQYSRERHVGGATPGFDSNDLYAPGLDEFPAPEVVDELGGGWDRRRKINEALRSSERARQLLDRLRGALRRRGTSDSLHQMVRRFRMHGGSAADGVLHPDELQHGLRQIGVGLSDDEVHLLFRVLDVNGDGVVRLEEWLQVLRGQLSPQRMALVKEVFNSLDRNGDGVVTVRELEQKYRPSEDLDVVAGRKSRDDAMANLLISLGDVSRDGQLTLAEFVRYYESVSMYIDSDQYFAHVIRNAWRPDADPCSIRERNARRDYNGHIRATEYGLCF
eukprot:TRINITY_DN14983_c0_g1_i1.p1 TRINITY_DN14983_c0_g1~~TRINITY_DN14983_c0_g1_i1.p1  ORF type:complete len:998 (+),score=169.32 TRINITY_DN14983_c0_g1_i1:77-3070(+)